MLKYILSVVLSAFIGSCFSQTDSMKRADSLLMNQLMLQMSAPPVQTRNSPSANPNMSVIGDFQGGYHSEGKRNYDAGLNEAEMAIQSVVDPYARADFFLSFGKDASGDFRADVEEGFLTTTSLPWGLQLKAGKFKSALGRINPLHPHTLAFISLPQAYENYFGEGINDEGLQLSWLIPNPVFYQELTLQGTDGPRDCPSFARSPRNKYLSLAHLKNFWDLSRNATLELGFSAATGANDSDLTTNILAADLTYKWKPLQFNTYKSFTWQSEVFYSNRMVAKTYAPINSLGMYSFMNFQFARRWFFTGMFSYSQKPYSEKEEEVAYSTTFGWYATEFQKIEIEGKTVNSNVNDRTYQALLRWIFVIGSHGAHQY